MKSPVPALLLALLVFLASISIASNPNYKDPATPISLPQIENARALLLTTDLSAGGFIFIPQEAAYTEMAQTLQLYLEKMGTPKFNIITTLEEVKAQPAEKPGIVLGHPINSPLMARLYWNGYTLITPTYPGTEGYLIETVHQPLPLMPATNIVVIGASNPQENKKAVDFFLNDVLARQQGLKLPVLLEFNPAPQSRQPRGKGDTLQSFRGFCDLYHRSGNPEALKKARETLDYIDDQLAKNPDWVLVWGDEINSYLIAQSWDFFAEHALAREIITPEDFFRYERFFLKIINKLIPKSELFDIITPDQSTLAWNHSSIPLLGIYTHGRYFITHYPKFKEQLQVCLDRPNWYFMGQIPNYRVSCDAQYYQVFSLRFILAYYLMTDQMAYFENGNARKMVQLALSQVDNNGHFVGSGDAGSPFGSFENGSWPMIDFACEMPDLYWFASLPQNKYVQSKNVLDAPFRPGTTPKLPEYLLGVVSMPFDKGMYDYLTKSNVFRMMGPGYVPFAPPAYPLEDCFDKIQFRTITDTGGEYVLLDGFARGNHNHFDTNAIETATMEGYKFLFDSDYLVARSADHTMLNVVKDGRTLDAIPGLAGIYGLADFPTAGYSCTGVKNYNDVEWKRHIYWQKNGFFLVVDTVLAEKPGNFGFDNVWKVLNRSMETFDGQNLCCKAPNKDMKQLNPIMDYPPQTFWLRSADADNNWWNHRVETRYMIPNHRVHQNKFLAMSAGDMVSFQNTFYVERTDSAGEIRQYIPQRLDTKALILHAGSEKMLALVENAAHADAILQGLFALVGQNQLFAVNARSLSYKDQLVFTASTDISLSLQGKDLLIKAEQPGRCTLTIKGVPLALDYPAGASQHQVPSPVITPEFAKAIAQLTPTALKTKSSQVSALRAKNWKPSYLSPVQDNKHGDGADLAAGVLSSKIGPVVLTATKNSLICRNAKGKQLWQFDNDRPILSCALMQVPGEKTATILAGTNKREVIAVDAAGKKIKQVEIPVHDSAHFGVHDDKPWINNITVYDLDKDGDPEIFLGLESWQIHMYDHELNYLWHNAMILHGVWDVTFADANNDGSEEIIVGDRYGNVYNLNPKTDDKYSWRQTVTAIGDTTIAALDLDGDKLPELINCSDSGKLTAFKRVALDQNDYEPFWRFDNFGFGHFDVDVLPGKAPQILVASESGYLYYLKPSDGSVLRQAYLDKPVTVILALPSGKVLAGTEAGKVFQLDEQGKILCSTQLSSKIIRIRQFDKNKVAVLDTQGQMAILSVK